ncbi:CAP-Gly domain-containing linker protein 2 [Trichosurus vulpecula]|uniref:CAP-Gly domain-containing linker protein 2 n=1 Tax=Trichosurus vulpecula TaxID=9337 RepID=UPI00186B14EB|nr:CAP-Gly domain-containing linker protein 2 [Trichosurus vulpecula]
MLKPSGLKIPNRGGKHSSPVGRTSSGSSSAVATTSSKEGSPLHKQASGPTAATATPAEKPCPKVAEVGDDFLGDFVVGERVWVNGVKPGVVQYLGETQFAPGQWAGVVLDDPVGKNDGSVGGVRYFECQPLQGIFTRPSKLTRQPTAEGSGSDAHSVESLTAQNLSLHSGTATPPLSTRVIPLRESVLNSSMKTGNESGSNLSDSGSVKKGDKDLRLGDRVLTQTQLEHARIGELEQSLLFEKAQAEKLLRELEDNRMTTVAEQSRILQLEEELSLRRGEIEELQQCLRQTGPTDPSDTSPSSEALRLREQLLSASKEHQKESGLLKDKYEKALKAYQLEVERLKATNEKYAQEIVDLKHKVQQATSENMGLMDNWKSKLDTLASDHQKSLEDLKATLNSGPNTQHKEIVELKAVMESIKLEHQLELGNLRAKHDIETAVLAKEKESLLGKLEQARDELEEVRLHWKAQLEARSNQHLLELQEAKDQCRDAELRARELGKLDGECKEQAQAIDFLKEQISLAEKKMLDYEALQRTEAQSKQEIQRLQEKLLVTENKLQAMESLCSSQHSDVIETNDISEEKIRMKQTMEDLQDKLSKRDKEVASLVSQTEMLKAQVSALEGKCKSGDKKADALLKEKKRLEAELEAVSRKTHDASGQLVLISQELLKKERSLNELRALLLEANRHSPGPERDLSREVHKAEWRLKEQKLKDDIRGLREKLVVLDKERSASDQRRYSLIDASSESEVLRLQHRLVSTEDVLRSALEQGQQMEKLMEAMRSSPEKSQTIGNSGSTNGIHQQDKTRKQEEKH